MKTILDKTFGKKIAKLSKIEPKKFYISDGMSATLKH